MRREKITWLWADLQRVGHVQFFAKSRTNTGWSGAGIGSVVIEVPNPDTILFHESGNWQSSGGKELAFRNVFRWQRREDRIRLEHLRFGVNQPVYLFDLAPESETMWAATWKSDGPHLCRDDEYTARLEYDSQWEWITLEWNVRGPEKNEQIVYVYT